LSKFKIYPVRGVGYELPDSKVMQIRTDESEFTVIKKAVCEVAGCTEIVDEVDIIHLFNEDRPQPIHRGTSIFTKVGCSLSAVLIAVLLIAGIIKIGELIWK
jgi:hypothetical protein